MIFILFLVLVAAVFSATVKIVRPFQRGVIEELGRYKKTLDPGLRFVIPVLQRLTTVDMRETVINVPPQQLITSDNVAIEVDGVIYYEATEPNKLLYNVEDFQIAIIKLAQTNLRNVLGEETLDQALTSRERINTKLRIVLDEITGKWGVRVTRVEIQRIDPPNDVVASMHKQVEAERLRRAAVLEARGSKEAKVLEAEGSKEAAVLEAEGQKQATILQAEAEATAVELAATAERTKLLKEGEGEALALAAIKKVGADQVTVQVRYLEALEKIGEGESTKIIVPTELSGLAGLATALKES